MPICQVPLRQIVKAGLYFMISENNTVMGSTPALNWSWKYSTVLFLDSYYFFESWAWADIDKSDGVKCAVGIMIRTCIVIRNADSLKDRSLQIFA
jgi:hypothetical protein